LLHSEEDICIFIVYHLNIDLPHISAVKVTFHSWNVHWC